MSGDYDPNLQALFIRAEQEFDHDAFTRDVMARINRERRKVLLLWSVTGVVVIICLAFLARPAWMAIDMVSQVLPGSLVDIRSERLASVLSPINNIGAAIALGFLALRKFYRRIFR
jgi:hypothetical protein